MSEHCVILTEHRLLPRCFDAVLTLIAWCGFLFFLYVNLVMKLTESSGQRWDTAIEAFNTLLVYLLIAVANGWLLILWYQYNRRRTHARRHARLASLENDELARSFNIAPQMISELSQYNLLTVYHDNIGRIIDLKAEPPQNRG